MKDIHDLRLYSDMFYHGVNIIEVNGNPIDIIKRFEQKKLSGSPFVVYDNENNLWAFDVAKIDYINIDNVEPVEEDGKE